MLKLSQIKLPITHTEERLPEEICKRLHIPPQQLRSWYIDKKSIDARKKPQLYYVYAVCVTIENEAQTMSYLTKKHKAQNIQLFTPNVYNSQPTGTNPLTHRPVVVGAGPAGLFCAYELALQGFCPLILERGAAVDERQKDVEQFWETGILNPQSNVQFGEGGAGTFSDGKLNTGVKDPNGRNRRVLEVLVEHGAPASILYDGKPHIGTDILINVVRNMRNHIITLGGEVRFHAQVTDIYYQPTTLPVAESVTTGGDLFTQTTQVTGVQINNQEVVETNVLVLAIGHSARDTFEQLLPLPLLLEPKAFAVGLRMEHPQQIINDSQYGYDAPKHLPAAPYKVTANLPSGRGVYSFCMCPGGYVVNASSEEGRLAINGMSYSNRDGSNANSAIVVTVTPQDYLTTADHSPLSGMYFQQELERKAYQLGNGAIPVQRFADYCANSSGNEQALTVMPMMKGRYTIANVRSILPEAIGNAIEEGITVFGKRIRGFDSPDAILSGVETRTSSPIRILRNTALESPIQGLYPCGEGAGYAGGITSAAIDGLKVYEAISKKYQIRQKQVKY